MSKENTRNVIILKNLPSNLIAEAILVVKDKKQVAEYMKESEFGANKDVSNCKTYNNGIIYGDIKTESLKKIENVKKEDRKYVIKEAEIVVSNYIKRIEDKLKIERKEAKEIMEQHIKYYLDHDIYSIDDAIATYRLENEENMSRDKAIATAQYATQVMNGEDVNKMTAKRKKEYKDTFIPKFIEKGSKNPEEDVEKVFDNVSKFYLLKK